MRWWKPCYRRRPQPRVGGNNIVPLTKTGKPEIDAVADLDHDFRKEFEASMPFVMKGRKVPEPEDPPKGLRSIDDDWEDVP